MVFLYNKHSNMRICWTCEIWNDHSLLTTGPQNSITAGKGETTHTHIHRCLYLSHTLMMWSESQWNVMRFGSSDWLKKQEVKTFHTHSNSHSTTNDQWEAQTLSDWANQNLSSWWEQQGLDKQRWVAKTALSALLKETNKASLVKE